MNKKNKLSHYPSFFLSSLVLKSVSWLIFSILFISLGKRRYIEKDILGTIYNSIFNKNINFNEYFLGGVEIAEKSKIFKYAPLFLTTIVVFNIFSLWYNLYLWKKKSYIENNNFYLHNKWIFISNSLIHIACACLLILSFVSPFTAIFALLFITFNNFDFLSFPKKTKNPKIETFFSWKNQYIRRMALYSVIIIFVIPLIIDRVQIFHNGAMNGSPQGFSKAYQALINSSSAARALMELVFNTSFGPFYWFILLWYVRETINDRWGEFTKFWIKVKGVKKRVDNFKFHYYYQKNWSNANNSLIYLGDYNYLKNNPSFLTRDYLETDLNNENFAKRNHEIVIFIEFCESNISDSSEKNFLNYCLFDEFNSWNDFLRTRKLIKMARK
ncbi:MAG: hypothetical protein mread185_000610 [Mycoplasmataceae bacterium]|nr:MAG: hypothetical protein mread185_000610 [Mycoplasmataceae bacterium]